MFRFETVKSGCLLPMASSLVLLLAFMLLPSALLAAEMEQFMVRGGPIFLKADNARGDVTLGGNPQPGAAVTVDDELHYGLVLTMALNRNFSLETFVSTPLKVDILAGGGAFGSEFRAAQVDVMPLMLIGRYTPQWDWYGLRPFAGIGAAYILFDNAKTTETFDAVGASYGLQNPHIDVDAQLRPVVELGLDYLVGANWFVNASWLYLEGDDEVSVTYSNGVELVSRVSYAPQLYALTLGYRF